MENQANFNFQRFAPKKASRWYLVRVLIYTIFLVLMGYLIVSQLNKVANKKTEVKEIERVTIELE